VPTAIGQVVGPLRREVVYITFSPPLQRIDYCAAHHFDPMTGEDEFLADGEEPAPRSRQERRAAAKQGNGAPLTPRKAGGRDGAAPGWRPQQARGRGQRGPAGPAVDPGNPASWGKVARNAPCPCGSGKKFKHCHGAIASAAAE